MRRAARNAAQIPAPARVVLAGEASAPLSLTVVPVSQDGVALAQDDGHGTRTVDAVVIGSDVTRQTSDRLAVEAGALAIPLIRLGKQPLIDARAWNPRGWRRETGGDLGVLLTHPDRTRSWGAVERLARVADRDRIVLLVPAHWSGIDGRGFRVRTLAEGRERSPMLQALRGVLDLPELHQSVPDRARWILELSARGVPVAADATTDLADWLAPELLHVLAEVAGADLDDPECRERVSIDLRRTAHRLHGPTSRWNAIAADAGLPPVPEPSISVVLATNRPDRVRRALERIDRQDHRAVEIVLALHGDGFNGDLERHIPNWTDRPTTTLRIPRDRTLGAVLNEATARASGDLIAKMDDDDLYDRRHLSDLVEALRYSDATLVGKGSEYVYLEELDVTIRRLPHGAERPNRNIAGGTLLIGRDDLREAGSWQSSPRAIDQRLMDDVEAAGGRVHRTHGHGFVLFRTAGSHTWNAPVDYFLRQAVAQWRGLALEQAGVG
ncbi:MAG: glycosyltransferase [Nitriliruptoraceae bacterium]|nr:glycosyltransferase [Nitriliruptoraceae bacterium]